MLVFVATRVTLFVRQKSCPASVIANRTMQLLTTEFEFEKSYARHANLVARWSSTTGRWSSTDNYGSAQLWPVGMLY
jgi:hypothetical protein